MFGEEERKGMHGRKPEFEIRLEVIMYINSKKLWCHTRRMWLRKTCHTVGQKTAVILDGNRKQCQNSYTRTWDKTPPNVTVHGTVNSKAEFHNFHLEQLFREAYNSGSFVTDSKTTAQFRQSINRVRSKMEWCPHHGVGPWCLKNQPCCIGQRESKISLNSVRPCPCGAAVYLVERSYLRGWGR